MENSVKRRLIAALVIAVGFIVIQGVATAQFYYTCIVVNGQKVYVTYDDTQGDGTASSGSGTFQTQGPIPPTGPLNVSFILGAAGVSLTTTDPVYGIITTTSTTAPAGPTTVVSNSQTQRYPATGTIRFFATATLSSKPGITYTSGSALVFVNNNLQSFDPFSNETFTLQNDVTFAGGSAPFILKAGTTVTLDGEGNGLN